MIKLSRPTSERELRSVVDSAYALARQSKYDEAFDICEWLIADKSSEVAGYRERAAIKEHMNDIEGAIADLQVVVARADGEPADFHSLGLLLLQIGSTVDAISAFTQAIVQSDQAKSHYYTNSARLFRAVAHLKRTEYSDASADIALLPAGYKAYLPGSGMYSREDIVAEINAFYGPRKPRNPRKRA